MSSKVTYREHRRAYTDDWNMVDTKPVVRDDCIELLSGPGIASYILVNDDNTLVVVTDAAYEIHYSIIWNTSLWVIQDGGFVDRVSDEILLDARAAARNGILADDIIEKVLSPFEDERYYTLEALI
jgi:hypothetical protein